jgi:DNA-binding NtrC family response regulator
VIPEGERLSYDDVSERQHIVASILVIDDQKDMLALLRRIISEETGHGVIIENNPLKALDTFHARTFDLVFTDLKMPHMDGLQVMERIHTSCPGTPVIIMTAFGTIDTAVDAVRRGAFDYITKPFSRERILATIDKAVSRRAGT